MPMELKLSDIRKFKPCVNGWKRLITALGGVYDPDRTISIGDVVLSNDMDDAMWCLRALDWTDVNMNRVVVRALLPSVHRATVYALDPSVFDCVTALKTWTLSESTAFEYRSSIVNSDSIRRHNRSRGLASYGEQVIQLAAYRASVAAYYLAQVVHAKDETDGAVCASRAADYATWAANEIAIHARHHAKVAVTEPAIAKEIAIKKQAIVTMHKKQQMRDIIACFPLIAFANLSPEERKLIELYEI